MEEYFASGPHQNCREVVIARTNHVIRCEDCGSEEQFNPTEADAKRAAVRRIAMKSCS